MNLVFFLIAYLLGSVPFGLLLARWAGHGDIRAIGSGNIGATNVLRTGDKKLAALTLFLDGAKGAVAILLAKAYLYLSFGPLTPTDLEALHRNAVLLSLVGLGAVLGHLFPVWLKFKGGKGVATVIGVTTALVWQAGVTAMGIWIFVAVVTRYSSLAALVAIGTMSLTVAALGWPEYLLLTATLTLLVFLKHRPNIRRLLDRTETKIGAKSKEEKPSEPEDESAQ